MNDEEFKAYLIKHSRESLKWSTESTDPAGQPRQPVEPMIEPPQVSTGLRRLLTIAIILWVALLVGSAWVSR